MGLRESISKRPLLIGILVGGCLVALIVSAVNTYNKGGGPSLPRIPGQSFYTVDDGATVFTDSLWLDPPFDHDGHAAVRAYVFTCDGGAHHWVQYLEKWSPEDELKRERAKTAPPGNVVMPNELRLLVKKPGAKDWIPRSDRRSASIITPVSPDGMGSGPPASVQP